MPTNVTGMGTLAGGVSGVPATAMPGGLQSAGMASIELGKKRMRDSNDDLLMVPRLMHGVHFPFFRSWTLVKWPRYRGDSRENPVVCISYSKISYTFRYKRKYCVDKKLTDKFTIQH